MLRDVGRRLLDRMSVEVRPRALDGGALIEGHADPDLALDELAHNVPSV